MESKTYRIGDLARAAGVNPRTIDFYTRMGLLQPVSCTASKYRLYSEESLERLKTIQSLKDRRFRLEQIREALEQRATEVVSDAARIEQELEELRERITALKGQSLDTKARAVLAALAVRTMALSQSLVLLLEEGKTLL